MSYLSSSENVGGIPQSISDASCATQYKMAVESVTGNCGDVNIFLHDNSGEEQAYLPHFNDNFFHSKFKVDANELYTFQDSDIIAGEITVCHTEDNFIFTENDGIKDELLESSCRESDIINSFTNGEIKEEVVPNGHYSPIPNNPVTAIVKDNSINTKALKGKIQNPIKNQQPAVKSQSKVVRNGIQHKESSRTNSVIKIRRPSVHSSKDLINNASVPSVKTSVNTNQVKPAAVKQSGSSETFLDVFKREQGLSESSNSVVDEALPVVVKTEPKALLPPAKIPGPTPKKTGKPQSQSYAKVRRGRGPTVHEALQRIPPQNRAVPVLNRAWHAPGDDLFECGPLDDKLVGPFKQIESGSSDDEYMPDFEAGSGAVCVEETAVESRGARLALRRAALRRHVVKADTSLRFAKDHQTDRALATLIKKQLSGPCNSRALPPQTLNHLLAMRGMSAVLNSQERRKLRESGWSGGESGRASAISNTCGEDECTEPPLPCARYCLTHITLAPEQRLYASCSAVFAGGERCKQALLPLHDQTLLCSEHAWKRDNYDKLTRVWRPRKLVRASASASPRRAKRRKRPTAKHRLPPDNVQPPNALSDMNVGSNSSTYDSSEDTALGGQSENEYVVISNNAHELEVGEVGHVPPDDILDPAVLSQIPDEAFTEFFNQGGASFVETSELTAALEAVLDERALDSIADCVFTHSPRGSLVKNKMQVSTMNLEMSSSAPS